MIENLSGGTAVITGAASGIGLELAHRFGSEGMNLVLADVEAAALDEATAALESAGYRVVSLITDVRELDQIQALEALARDRFGAVHVLCNNAGVGGGGEIAGLDNLEMWRWVIDVDLWGVIYGCKVFLPAMIEHGEPCHVINTASMAGLGSMPAMGAYCVAKHGVVALSESLSLEMGLAKNNVGVSVLCPAFVKTGIANSGRNLPEELQSSVREPSAVEGGLQDFVTALVEGGMSTELVADAVLDAIAGDKFWILTHDGSGEAVVAWAESVAAGRRPTMALAPTPGSGDANQP